MLGLVGGVGSVWALSRRFPAVNGLTLPMKAFLTTSTGTFFAIIGADRASRSFELERQRQAGHGAVTDSSAKALQEYIQENRTPTQRALEWTRTNRYGIVFGAWVVSIGTAFALVSRNRYLTTPQKIVQARVYAQGLTLAVIVASAGLEIGDANRGKGRWEEVMVLDPDDPTHQHMIKKRIHHEEYEGQDLWRDMVDAEERKLNERHQSLHLQKKKADNLKEETEK